MRFVVAACVLLAWAVVVETAVAAEEDRNLSGITAQLEHSAVLRADFLQERRLRVLGRPLVSQGRLLFVSGKGVLWRVTEPQAVELLVRPDEVIEFTNGNARRAAIGESPVFRTLVQVFLAGLSGSFGELEERFDLAPVSSPLGWRLILTPTAPGLAAVIAEIELRGRHFVEEIRIAETTGDSTHIFLSNFQTGPADLDAVDRRYFAD